MRKDEMGKRVKEILHSKKFFVALTVLMCLLALLSLLFVFLRFVGIGRFEIKGSTEYRLSELISASGLRTGDAMFSVNEKQAEEKLLDGCPYLKSVKVKKKFPNRVCFEVEERILGWYLCVGDDFYALDYDMMVLLETYDEEALIERGLTRLVLPELESVMCDYLPQFGRGDEQLVSQTLKIIDVFRNHQIKQRLTYLDLSNRFEIKLTVDSAFEVNIGDTVDIETKLLTALSTIQRGKEKGYAGGELNMITPTSFSFKGYFASEDVTDPTDGKATEAEKREEEE